MIYKPSKPFDTTVAASNAPAWVRAIANYVCDGTDDDVQINAAISNNAGKKVYLSSGTFNTGNKIIINQSNTVLEGQGRSTIIKLSNGVNTSIIEVSGGTQFIYYIQIKNLSIEGNKANQTGTSHGIYFNKWVAVSKIENIDIHDCLTDGIRTIGTQISTFLGIDNPSNQGDGCHYNTISACTIRDCGGNGIHVEYSHHLNISNSPMLWGCTKGIYLSYSNSFRFYNIFCANNTSRGLELSNTDNGQCSQVNLLSTTENLYLYLSQNNSFSNCYFEGGDRAINLQYSLYNVFNNCSSPFCQQDMVKMLGSQYNKFIGCSFRSASQATTNTHPIFRVENYSHHNLIQGCTLFNRPAEASKLPIYAYKEWDNTCDNNKLIDNIFNPSKYGNGVFSIAGLNNVYYDAKTLYLSDLKPASVNHICVAVQNLTTGTIANQPDVQRNVTITQAGTGTPASGNVLITGVDASGVTISETIAAPASNTTTLGVMAFAKITSVAGFDAGTNQTLAVGIGDKIGIRGNLLLTSDVYKVKKNNTNITVPTVNLTNKTIDLSIISDGDDFTVWFKHHLNTIS